MTSHSIYDLQTCLRKISVYNNNISPVIPDGIFGEQTERSLKEFQKAYGLEPHGRADYKTWIKLTGIYEDFLNDELPPESLHALPKDALPIIPDSKSIYLYVIQAVLKTLAEKNGAFLSPEVNGIHGEESVNAIKIIQKISSLPQTGIIDKKTWNSIAGIYSSILY